MKTRYLGLALFLTLFTVACDPALEPVADPVEGDSEMNVETPMETSPEVESSSEEGGAVYVDYTPEAYVEALEGGQVVFLDFFADWCPTCRANAPEVEAAFEVLPSSVSGFKVDFDEETELRKELGVTTQSTYLRVEEGQEVDRLAGTLEAADLINFLQ